MHLLLRPCHLIQSSLFPGMCVHLLLYAKQCIGAGQTSLGTDCRGHLQAVYPPDENDLRTHHFWDKEKILSP